MLKSLRSFDLWNRYLDNDGNILRGCIQFMVLDGTTSAPIFDSDGVALSNPQITDIYGRTQHQVFIKNDVLVYFYKYVGQGTIEDEEAQGIDTSDETKWSLQYTAESQLTVDLSGSADSIRSVEDMTALHALDPATIPATGDKKFIQLMGYYEEGDLEPAYYWWDETSTENDDGGSIIAGPELTGRWKLIPPAVHLDVRRFGAFPYSSSNNASTQRVKIMNAVTYANRVGLRVWFPKYEETTPNIISYKYYKYDTLNLTFQQGIDIDSGVQFLDDGNNSSWSLPSINGDPYFVSGKTGLIARYARASWNLRSIMGYGNTIVPRYVIDTTSESSSIRTLTGFDVEVGVNITGFTFTNCRIHGKGGITYTSMINSVLDVNGTIGNYNVFSGCHLTETMFNGSPSPQTAISNCTLDIDEFQNKLTFWRYLTTLTGLVNIDFRNLATPTDMSIFPVAVDSDFTISNFKGNGTNRISSTSNPHLYTFNDCTGTFDLVFNANGSAYVFNNFTGTIKASINKGYNQSLYFEGCNVVIDDDLTGSMINAKNSTIVLKSSYNSLVLKDSILEDNGKSEISVKNFTSYYSILNNSVKSEMSVVKGSQINKQFTQSVRDLGSSITVQSRYDSSLSVTTSKIIDGYFDGNIFNAQLMLYSNIINTLVRGLSLINNSSGAKNPVIKSAGYIRDEDDLHYYIYRNNTGTMEMVSEIPITYIKYMGNPEWDIEDLLPYAGVPGYAIQAPISEDSDMYGMFATSILYIDQNGNPQYNFTQCFSNINLFTIGTKNVRVSVEIEVQNIPEITAQSSNGMVKFPQMVSGNELLVSPKTTGYTFQPDQYVSYPYHIEFNSGTGMWTIKNINIGLGELGYSPASIIIRQK